MQGRLEEAAETFEAADMPADALRSWRAAGKWQQAVRLAGGRERSDLEWLVALATLVRRRFPGPAVAGRVPQLPHPLHDEERSAPCATSSTWAGATTIGLGRRSPRRSRWESGRGHAVLLTPWMATPYGNSRPVGSDTIHASIAHGNAHIYAVLTTFLQETGASPSFTDEVGSLHRTPRTKAARPDAWHRG